MPVWQPAAIPRLRFSFYEWYCLSSWASMTEIHRYMKTLYVCLVLLVGVTAQAFLFDFSISYPLLTLKSGKVYKNVTLTSYDAVSGKVSARANGMLTTMRIEELPDDVVARIKERVPQLSEEQIKEKRQQAKDDALEAKRRASELEKRQLDEVKANRDTKRQLDAKKAGSVIVKEAATADEIEKTAMRLAKHYFTYEADKHAPVGWTFDTNILLDDPEPVPGWTNRWRVNGKIGTTSLSQTFGSIERKSRNFEMLIEAPEKGKPKLIDVTLK